VAGRAIDLCGVGWPLGALCATRLVGAHHEVMLCRKGSSVV
jgi:hypothetical protein